MKLKSTSLYQYYAALLFSIFSFNRRVVVMVGLLYISGSLLAAPIVITVGSIADADCDYNTIQEAVDSGTINMDVRVSNQLNTTTSISILDGDDVGNLSGGYFTCQDARAGIIDDSNPYTSVTPANGSSSLNIGKHDPGNDYININNFKFHNGALGVIVTSGFQNNNLIVDINFVDIYDNISSAIQVEGSGAVVNFDNGKLYGNSSFFGAGVACFNAELNLGENVAIYNNIAQFGGGLYARDCTINILAGDNNPLDALQMGIYNNQALQFGGGIYMDESTLIGLGVAAHPISISGNEITGSSSESMGGGVYMLSGSTMQVSNIRLDGNKAFLAGAALASIHNDVNLQPPTFVLTRSENGCNYSELCSSLSYNSLSGSGYGTVINQVGGGFGYLVQSAISNNGMDNSNSLFKVKSGSQLLLFSDLIASNLTASHLFDQEDESGIYIQYSTIANNMVSNHFNIQYDNSNPQILEVVGTIIKNGAATIANLNNDDGNHDAKVVCSLVESDDATGIVQNLSVIGDPSFISNSNYKLQPNSLAIDRTCSFIGEFDLSRYDIRNQDRTADGVPDLGAYENISMDDVIYSNGFDNL